MPTFKNWIASRTAEGTPADADELYLRDDSGDVSKRVTWAGLKTALGLSGGVTAFGGTLLDDDDAAAARTTLGAAPLASAAVRGVSAGYYGIQGVAASTLAMVDGTEYAAPILMPGPSVVNQMSMDITAAAVGATLRFGIRATDATQWKPGAVLVDQTRDAGSTGRFAVSFAGTALPTPGWYWLVAVAQGGTPTVRAMTGGQPIPVSIANVVSAGFPFPNHFTQTGVTGALPSTYTPAAFGTDMPRIGFRVEDFT